MLEVEILNYKTIKHVKFEISGYTTLLGKNFIGKSAIVGAINAALINKPGTNFIRWGESFCEVRLKHYDKKPSDGIDITWHKESGNNYYIINGKEYLKVGRDIPQELLDIGYGPQLIGKQKVHFLYAQQFNPLFLIDDTDSEYVTDLMSEIFKIDVVYKAQELCKKDLKKDRSLLKVRNSDKLKAEGSLGKYGDMDALVESIEKLEGLEESVGSLESEVETLESLLSTKQESLDICRKIKPVTDIPEVDIEHPENLILEILGLESLSEKLVKYEKELESLKGVPSVKDHSDSITQLDSLQTEVSTLTGLKSRLAAKKSSLSNLLPVRDLPHVEVPEDLLEGFNQIEALHDKYKECYKNFNRLSPVKDIQDQDIKGCESLDDEIESLQVLVDRLTDSKELVRDIKEKLEEVQAEELKISEELGTYDNCPMCGADI